MITILFPSHRSMSKFHALVQTVLIIALFSFAGSGCTKEARKARLMGKAKSAFESGAYDKAKIEYLNVLQLSEQSPDPAVFARLGQIWFEEGAPMKAGAFLVKTRELTPNDLESRLRLARVYKAVGTLAEGRKEIHFVLQQSPGNGEALMLLTEMSFTPEDVKAAEQSLQQFPQKESVWYQLAAANIALRKSDPGNGAGIDRPRYLSRAEVSRSSPLDGRLSICSTRIPRVRLQNSRRPLNSLRLDRTSKSVTPSLKRRAAEPTKRSPI